MKLDEVQRTFTASVDFCINERKDLENPDFLPMTILSENQPVGFFVLDFGKMQKKFLANQILCYFGLCRLILIFRQKV